MKVKLRMQERLVIANMFESKGTYLVLRSVRGLQTKLGATKAEEKEYKFVVKGNQITWDPKKDMLEKEFNLEDSEVAVIKTRLKELDDSKQLGVEMVSIFEKFCT